MNLFFRLLWLAIVGRRRSRVSILGPCRTPFRVLPTDLDVLRHMNNGVYFSLMDVARVDLMIRAGALRVMRSRGWYPVVVAETMQFRRSLLPFQRFEIVTRVVTWDDKSFLLEQWFERDGEMVARALLRSRFLSKRGGAVPTAELLAAVGVPFEPAPADVSEPTMRWYADNSVWLGESPQAPRPSPIGPTARAGR